MVRWRELVHVLFMSVVLNDVGIKNSTRMVWVRVLFLSAVLNDVGIKNSTRMAWVGRMSMCVRSVIIKNAGTIFNTRAVTESKLLRYSTTTPFSKS